MLGERDDTGLLGNQGRPPAKRLREVRCSWVIGVAATVSVACSGGGGSGSTTWAPDGGSTAEPHADSIAEARDACEVSQGSFMELPDRLDGFTVSPAASGAAMQGVWTNSSGDFLMVTLSGTATLERYFGPLSRQGARPAGCNEQDTLWIDATVDLSTADGQLDETIDLEIALGPEGQRRFGVPLALEDLSGSFTPRRHAGNVLSLNGEFRGGWEVHTGVPDPSTGVGTQERLQLDSFDDRIG